MILPWFPVIWMDVLGSGIILVLAVLCAIRSWRWAKKRREDSFRHYVFLLTLSLVFFAVSRSFGHLVKQALMFYDMNHIWIQIAPYSGSINTATFVTVFAFGMYFHRSYNVYLELEQHKEHLEELVEKRTTELAEINVSLQKEITERLQVEKALQQEIVRSKQAEDKSIESERKLFILMSNMPGMAYRCLNDINRTMEFVSNGCLGLTGYKSTDLLANKTSAYNDLIHPDDQRTVWDKVQHSVARKQSFHITYRIITAESELKWVGERGVGVFSEEGNLLALEGFITDITEEKKAEEALNLYKAYLENLVNKRTQTLEQEIVERENAEKRFRDLLESAPDAMALVDMEGNITFVNKQMENLFNYSRDELLENNFEILIPERFREKHREQAKDYFASYQERPVGAVLDIYALRKNGEEFPADISLSPLETKDGVFVLADIRDITYRKQTEKKIKKSIHFESTINSVLKVSLEPLSLREQLENILDLILEIPILSSQKKGSIYLVEDTPEELNIKAHRGYDDLVLTECSRVPISKCLNDNKADLSTTIFFDSLAECLKCYKEIFPHGHYCIPIVSGAKVLGILNLALKEGHNRDKQEEEFLSTIAATIAGIVEHKKTESEKERLKNQLVESEKLSALGRMLANIAHEVRNPLTVVGGLTRRLDKKIPVGTKEKEYTKAIISESSRLERILTSVLTFTKGPSIDKEENDINSVVDESLQLLEFTFKEKSITVRKSFVELPLILVDRDQVRGVIDNLLANAIYVTPAGGEIIIETGREYLDEMAYITLRVTDTGSGITEDKLSMIFEPFFTTKPVGPNHGIGLGLSITRKIMEEHDGFIKVESKPGEGTTFILFFPQQS